MWNDIQIRLIRIINNVLKIEIIVEKLIDENILILRISLNLKNDDVNKKRKKIVLC
jgi:type IV secretory pathway component VirB8